jgi:predicted GNAT family N-acyltransferase
MANAQRTTDTTYTIEMLPPPGSVVAPQGFPADPRPKGAPQLFLDAMDVRIKVFCDEQQCALEPELDEDDPRSWHWVLYETPVTVKGSEKPQSEPVSVIRIVPPPHGAHPNGFEDPNEEPYCKLGRVATIAHARGKGLSRMVIEEAFSWLAENPDAVGHGWTGNVLAHAQITVEKMYNRLGFTTDEKLGHWDEEGIDHVGMWRKVNFSKR